MQFNGKSPSINQIRYFVAVAKNLSFRQAAGILGISQPTLTSQINALETHLGLTLFERSRTGTLLSPQGKALLDAAEEVLQASQRFSEIARDLSEGEVVTYRLGIPPTLGPYCYRLFYPIYTSASLACVFMFVKGHQAPCNTAYCGGVVRSYSIAPFWRKFTAHHATAV